MGCFTSRISRVVVRTPAYTMRFILSIRNTFASVVAFHCSPPDLAVAKRRALPFVVSLLLSPTAATPLPDDEADESDLGRCGHTVHTATDAPPCCCCCWSSDTVTRPEAELASC